MNALLPPLVSSLLLALALAGCLGGDDDGPSTVTVQDPAAEDLGSEVEATGGESSAGTGTIEGKVVDEKGQAMPGAVVRVTGSSNATGSAVRIPPAATDAAGLVRFTKVPVGSYTVHGAAEGFEARQSAVTVRKGETASFQLKLPPLIVDDAFNVTVTYEGRVTCWARVFLPGNLCGATNGPTVNTALGAAGKAWANDFRFPAGAQADPPVEDRLVHVLVEVEWTENHQSAGGQDVYVGSTPFGLTLVLTNEADDKNQNSTTAWHADDSPAPRVAFLKKDLDAWGLETGANFTFFAYPSSAFFNDAGVDIAYKAHATVFYNQAPPRCWSPMKGAMVC